MPATYGSLARASTFSVWASSSWRLEVDAMPSLHGLLSKCAQVCVLAFPAVSRAFNPVTVGSSLAEGRTFAPAWKQASVERVNTGTTLPLMCQSVNVDGTFIRDNARKPNEIREEGVPVPEPQGPAAGKTLMNCNVHNIGRLFDSGLPFGAELTRKPLAVRLANPGSTLCLNVPGELDAQPVKVRICVTGLAASARISYH
jgi:hypothetical protein